MAATTGPSVDVSSTARALQRRRVESLVLGALSSSPVHRALVLVLETNIAVLLDCSKTSRQCSLPYLLTYLNGAEPRRPASRGGPKGRPPPGPPPGHQSSLFHPPGVGPAQVGFGISGRMSEKRRRTGAVWCWSAAKFLHWKPRRREPHTPDTLRTRLRLNMLRYSVQKPHCPQCEGRDELEHLSHRPAAAHVIS